MRVLLSTLNAKYIQSSLALRYLRAYGKKMGKEYDIEEYTINMPIYEILRNITMKPYDVIGFACYIWNIEMTLHLVALIHAVKPEVVIVLGGPEVSYNADEVLRENPSVHYVVQGEGEEVFNHLIDRLNHRENPLSPSIAGLRGRTTRGDLAGSSEIVEVHDLDSIPFPYEGEEMENLTRKIIYYESSRGCPFNCQYCLSGNQNTVRFFSLDRVMKELQWFIDQGVKQVKFVDRTFNCAKHHHLPIMKFLAAAKTDTNFHLEMEGDVMGPEEVHILTTAPKDRFQIEVGIQSTHEPTLLAIRRKNRWDHIQSVISPIIKAERTHVHMDLIIGLPEDTWETFATSFNDLFFLGPQALQLGFLKLLKGSGVSRMEKYAFIYDHKAPYEVLGTHAMSFEEIRFLKIFEDVFETFYNSGFYGRFHKALQEVLPYNNAFLLYEEITKAWIKKGMHLQKSKDKDKIKFLYETLASPSLVSLYGAQHTTLLLDLLRIDILLTFSGKLKDSAFGLPAQSKSDLQENDSFWQDEQWVSSYMEGYKFTEWRRIRQDYYEMDISEATAKYLQFLHTRLVVDVTKKTPLFTRPLKKPN